MLRYRLMPVPAGMSLPMMTFSLRPTRASDLAWIAASVSTRVVSWKDAADSHDSVASEALVMPMSTGRPDAALGHHPPVLRLELRALGERARQELGGAGVDHGHPLEHLADDHLDVLVVDRHALRAVHVLDLADQVQLHLTRTHDPQHLVRVHRADDQLLADRDPL